MKIYLKLALFLCFLAEIAFSQSVSLSPTIPASPTAGTVVYNNGTNQLQYWNGSAWIPLTNAASGTGWALNGTNINNTNAGHVGIGTNVPSRPLTVIANGIGIDQESIDATTKIGFFTLSGDAYVQTHTNHDLKFATNNSLAQMTLQKGTGYLGIGTSIPVNKLQIGSLGLISGFADNDFVISNGQNAMSISQNNATTVLANTTDIVLRPRNNGTGYVGISADSPSNKLQIGSVGSTGYVGNDFAIGNGTDASVFFQNANYMQWYATKNIVIMPQNGNGNVGIGTTNPTYKLAVNGTIRAKEVIVETNWADYVFDDNYVIPKLREVEQFIKQNKHLPDMPSASEIQKNGAKLAELTTKMMQKIEEQTLYIIELQKQIDELKSLKK